MSVLSDVYQALKSSAELTTQLADGAKSIYHLHSPDAGTYPILQYSTISDVPALEADNREIAQRVTVRIHIITEDGSTSGIEKQIKKIMLGDLHFKRVQTNEINEGKLKIKILDYIIGVKTEE